MADVVKYTKLIGKSPEAQLKKLPKLSVTKCSRRTKTCSPRRDGCSYRYKKGDKTWVCPKCGLDRRCMTDKTKATKTCRMHGGSGGRPHEPKYVISNAIKTAFNRIIASPELLSLKDEIAMMGARTDQLHHNLDEFAISHSWQDMTKSIDTAQKALIYGDQKTALKSVAFLAQAIEPLRAQYRIWEEIRENNKILTAMMDKQHRWNLDNEMMMSVEDVISFLARMTMLTIKYIPAPQDRKAFMREVRQYAPDSGDEDKQ